jgi:hypothetical protein
MPLSSASGWRQDLWTALYIATCVSLGISRNIGCAKGSSPCRSRSVARTQMIFYRLIDNYMHQPRLVRIRITYIYNFFIIRRSLHYLHSLFELAAPKPEIRHQILRDRDHSKSLAETQKSVLVSKLNPFEFFFDCRKQVEVTRGQIR